MRSEAGTPQSGLGLTGWLAPTTMGNIEKASRMPREIVRSGVEAVCTGVGGLMIWASVTPGTRATSH